MCQRAGAQMPCPPEPCYSLSSEEASDILSYAKTEVRDAHSDWIVDKVGVGFICLDYCPPGDFIVAPGVFRDGRCIYKVTNGAAPDMVGESTEIVLRRKSS